MEITITLTPERYDALTKTAELHLPKGTPEEYLLNNVNVWCDSYAQTYPKVSLEVYKQRAEAAEAEKRVAEEKEQAAHAAREAAEAEKAQLQEALQKSLDAAEEKA